MKNTAIYCLIFLLLSQLVIVAGHAQQQVPKDEGPWVVLAHYQDKEDVLALKPFFDLWKIDQKNKTVLMQVDHVADYQELIQRGLVVEVNDELTQQSRLQRVGKNQGDPFACYRSVADTYTAMTAMQNDYPTLVSLIDIGDSWHKANHTGPGDTEPGYDMQVVKITNQDQVIPNKPILYAMGSIHAREYPPAELVTRFAEYLLSEYGSNADVTWLVDYHEIHLLLQGNPDGRVVSEVGPSANQRKNRNENHCLGGNQQGVDMNRNFGFQWNAGVCQFGCSSSNSCSIIFRGTSAISEPETMAINAYIQTLFPDERDDDLNAAAPLTKPGVYLDVHNVAELILFPWGFSDNLPQAPNHTELQTLARRMAYFSGYRPEQANDSLGGADGASEDNAYGTLGVAAFTIELGESVFASSCTAFENTIWPDNLPGMIYAAKAARMPYVIASGPDVIDLPTTSIQVEQGETINISGTATDLRFNNSNGTEPTQNITAVKAYLHTPSWVNGATAIDMTATDGAFDSKTEAFNGAVDSTGLAAGRYTLWLEATDASDVAGVPSAVFVDVTTNANLATLTGVIRDSQSNALIDQATVSYAGQMDNSDVTGQYSIVTTPANSDLMISKAGYLTQTINNLVTVGGQTTTQDIQLVPDCKKQLLLPAKARLSVAATPTAGRFSTPPHSWRKWRPHKNHRLQDEVFVATAQNMAGEQLLVSPQISLASNAHMEFWHKHRFEAGNVNYDGGVVEISLDGGKRWSDLGPYITENGYNGVLDSGFNNPLADRLAYTDTLGTFNRVEVDLGRFAGEKAWVRWRLGSDNSLSAGDWQVKGIQVFTASGCDDLIFANGFEG